MIKKSFYIFYLHFTFCIITFILLGLSVYATDDDDNLEDYFFEVNYNNFSGLPTSEANDIVQTSDGYIWIASYSCLIRYDGREFVTYSHIPGLSSVLCLFVDSQDRLWIGTNNNGAILYENNSFNFISDGQDIASFSARSISENSNGDILVGTALGMFKIDKNMDFEMISDSRIENTFVSELERFSDNKNFGITKTGDLFIIEGTQVIEFISNEEWEYDVPLCVLPLNDDLGLYFLIGTSNDYIVKLRQDANGNFTTEQIFTNNIKTINDLYQDHYGRIWIGADYGVGYMDSNNNIVDLYYLTMTKSIENIIEDFEGNFWMVSSKEGVSKLNVTILRNISVDIDVPTQMNGISLLNGYFYIASSNGIDIIRERDLTIIENALTEKYRGEYIRCVQYDLDGNLWFSSYSDDGLIKYNPITEEISSFSYAQGLDYSRIRSTMTASDGRIWVATGNGIYIIENDIVTEYYGSELGMLNLEILTITEDDNGYIFVGTDGAGVYIFKDGEIVHHLSRHEGLLSDIILRTETDPINGGTWIITGNSIAFYDIENDYLQNITKFPYGNNYDLLFYENTMIILCSNGIFMVEHEDMLSLDDGELEYLHKNHLNGLYSPAVANSFSIIEDGVIYLCGYQNITSYDLNTDSKTNSYIPPVSIGNIKINDDVIYASDENYYHLPSTANFLQFNIFIPTYGLNDYNVSYSLEGYDEFLHVNSYDSFVDPTYTNLPGGEYSFNIVLTDIRTEEILNQATYTIVKDYSFYENPIVRFIIVLAIIAIIYTAYMTKIIKNRRQKDEVTAMFNDTIVVLSKVIDVKDRYTNGHSKRVGFYTKQIATALNFSKEDIEKAYGIGLLHDIGKIAIPDEVLNKPGKLTKDEFEVMKTHAECGEGILEGIRAWPDLILGAKYHHERYDGKGYCNSLQGEDIPLIARIICVADAFDAMYSSRVYRKKMDLDVIIAELENNSGTQFDPEITKVFVELVRSGKLDEDLKVFEKEDNQEDEF